LTVHDELDGSSNFLEHIEAHQELKHIMETCLPLKVPVVADPEIGPNWADCNKICMNKLGAGHYWRYAVTLEQGSLFPTF